MVRPLIWLSIAVAASAQTAGISELMDKTVFYQDPAISPDGQYLAWAQTRSSPWSPEIHIAAVAGGGRPVTIHSADVQPAQTEPAWSPDSTQLAFQSASSGQVQIWTVSRNGSHAKQWTQLNGYVAHPRWSHDGRTIAFLYIEGAGGGGPLNAAPVRTGVIDEQIRNQRIAVLNLRSSEVRQVSPSNLHVYDFDWSPDDSTFVATAARGPGDNNWWIAQLYTFQVATGDGKSIYKPEYQLATPRWSPDGKTIAFIEGLMSDEGFHGGDLFTMSASGGTPVNRTRGRLSSPSAVYWTAPDRIVFTEWSGGGSAISELSTSDGSIRVLWQGAEGIHGYGNFPTFSLSRNGAAAVVLSTFTKPPEVWAGPAGNWRQMTNGNAELKPSWGTAESLEWSNDGFRVQGWLLPPKDVTSGKRYPMVVLVHGGPSGSEVSTWPAMFGLSATLSAQGYYVLMPNPRGSYGQGEQFTRANMKDFGGGDLRDILAGVDYAVSHYPVDPNRVGITGWSYGGYMTMWAVTQTNRFRAAMAGAGVADWLSYYGENLIDRWMIPFFGASVYDDPAVYAKSSPIQFIKNAKTPTLVIVGERDAECPAPQSYEFWHALRTLGVTTELVVYGGEGHMFTDSKDRDDVLERTIAWFDRYLR